MPYKLVVADDEEIIREGIISLINWEALGFHIVAGFEDGREVIEYCRTHPVDVVLSDIRMSDVSGLELAEYLSRNKPGIKVVLISGYKDFEYAKQAIQFNVANYITKPINFQEVCKYFNGLKLLLDQERERESREQEEKKLYNELLPMFREQFFTDLLRHVLRKPEDINNRIQMLGLNIEPANSICCITQVELQNLETYLSEMWLHGKDGLKNALRNFLQGKAREVQYFPVLNNQKELSVLAVSSVIKDNFLMEQSVKKYLNEKKEQIKSVIGLDIDFRILTCWSSIQELASSSRTQTAVYSTVVKATGEGFDAALYKRLKAKQELMIPYINAGDREAVGSLLEEYLEELDGLPLTQIHYFLFDLFALVTVKLKEIGLDLWEISRGGLLQHEFYICSQREEIREWCQTKLEGIIGYAVQQRQSSSNWVLKKAEEFIKTNYHRDISLEEVAVQVFLSSAYFSQFFKEGMGMNFSDYLVKIRIEKAIELLADSRYKIQDISQRVGYTSSKYFARIFKKYLGCTPSDYQLKLLQRGNGVE